MERENFLIDTVVCKKITKKNKTIAEIVPILMPIGVPVVRTKFTDASHLTKYFGEEKKEVSILE